MVTRWCKAGSPFHRPAPLVPSEQLQRYRSIGVRLAEFCQTRDQSQLTPAALQAVIADLAGDQAKLLIPLRDLVIRADLRTLAAQAGSGQAMALRDGLLQDLRSTYSPAVVAALAEVLNGLLDLPSDVPQRPSVAQSPPRPTARVQPRSSRSGWLVVALLTPLLLVGGALLLRQTPLCRGVGLCPVDTAAPAIEPALEAAVSAERALRRAGSLETYRQALQQLDEQLLLLRGMALSPEQRQQWTSLNEAALQARRTLAAETADTERLELAAAAITRLADLSGPAREQELNLARQYLEAIPSSSFSAAEASALRQRLDQILTSTPEQPPSGQPELTPPPAPPSAPVVGVPIPSSPPAPSGDAAPSP